MGVLEFSHGSTGLVVVVDLFLVTVEEEILCDAGFVQGCEDGRLLLGREGQTAASVGEILVPTELLDEAVHESLILAREHSLLESGEAEGIRHRF